MELIERIKKIAKKYNDICLEYDEVVEQSNNKEFSEWNNYEAHKDLFELYELEKKICVKTQTEYNVVVSQLGIILDKIGKIETNPYNELLVKRFKEHIRYNKDIITECLMNFEEVEKEINSLNDKIIYLINYCVILDRTSYFQIEFTRKLNELNNEMIGINNLSYKVYFRLGALNFKTHSYDESIFFLEKAICIMDSIKDVYYEKHDISEEALFRNKLFKAKMLYVVSHEYQGKFSKAIQLLVHKNIQDLIEGMSAENLLYSIGNEEHKNRVNKSVKLLIKHTLHLATESSLISFAQELDIWFQKKTQDKRILKLIKQEDNGLTFSNDYVHEVIHILAHCLNEHGVKKYNEELKIENSINKKLISSNCIILSRALMLFTATDCSFMPDCNKCLSCLSTIYAEAGDFNSSMEQLKLNLDSEYYKTQGMMARAEIDFFYFLINKMSNPHKNNEKLEILYKNYLNCCYSNFDYDALSQIEMYKFKYEVAEALLLDDIEDKKDEFKKLESAYKRFLSSSQSFFVNDWTKNEYSKIRIMFQFLLVFYEVNADINSIDICDLAKKYLYYFDKSESLGQNGDIKYFEKNDIQSSIKLFEKIFPSSTKEYESSGTISYRSCVLKRKNVETDNLDEEESNTNSVYFIYIDEELDVSEHIHCFTDENEAILSFLVFCAFDSIIFDFLNPKSIFIVVPFIEAEPLKYQLNSFNTLLDKIYFDNTFKYKVNVGQKQTVTRQFKENFEPNFFDENWLDNIFAKFPSAISMVFWNNEYKEDLSTRTRFFIRNKEENEIKKFPLFNRSELIKNVRTAVNKNSEKAMHTNCTRKTPNNKCRIIGLDNKSYEQLIDILNRSFCNGELIDNNIENSYFLIMFHENANVLSWRILIINKDNFDINNIAELKATLCGCNVSIKAEIDYSGTKSRDKTIIDGQFAITADALEYAYKFLVDELNKSQSAVAKKKERRKSEPEYEGILHFDNKIREFKKLKNDIYEWKVRKENEINSAKRNNSYEQLISICEEIEENKREYEDIIK